MITSRTIRWTWWVLAVLLLLCHPQIGLAANQYVVIASDPPADALPLGKVLKVHDTIEVTAGMTLKLLGDDGSVTTIRGPDKLVVTADTASDSPEAVKDRTTFERISDLLLGSSTDAEVLGVSRSLAGSSNDGRAIDPWEVFVENPGQACTRGASITLRRSKDLRELTLKVSTEWRRNIVKTVWLKDTATFELPSLGPDRVRKLTVQIGANSISLALHVLPPEIDTKSGMDVLAWMLEHGCKTQAIAFARSLSDS